MPSEVASFTRQSIIPELISKVSFNLNSTKKGKIALGKIQ
jgi:hypothetical protein